jgi:23S rRNA pseudouridine2605 synthase
MPQDTPIAAPPADAEGERIAKRLARAGLCSRRDAERWIAEGRVAVNGRVLDSPAFNVKPGDRIAVDGQPLPEREPTRVWRYHKPSGLVTTARDEKGRATVFEKLPPELPRVISVGRLDLTTEGLLLLTNDGELARHLELPATGWPRRYRVRVHGTPDAAKLAQLARGITLDGVSYGPIEAVLEREQGSNAWLLVTLREGKNREIRKVMEHLGLAVTRLIRVAYGPFQLGGLAVGAVEEVPRRVLRDQLPKFFPKEARDTAASAPTGRITLRLDRPPGAAKPGAAKPGAPKSAAPKSAAQTGPAKPTAARPAPKPNAARARAATAAPSGPAGKPGGKPGPKGPPGRGGPARRGAGGATSAKPAGRADRRR